MGEIIAAIIGAFAGIVGTYLAAILKFRKELEAEYDKTLRAKRIEAYQELWKATELFAKYAPPKPVIMVADVRALAEELRIWYFERGGMFLTVSSREAYFALQDSLKPFWRERTARETSDNSMTRDVRRSDRSLAVCERVWSRTWAPAESPN